MILGSDFAVDYRYVFYFCLLLSFSREWRDVYVEVIQGIQCEILQRLNFCYLFFFFFFFLKSKVSSWGSMGLIELRNRNSHNSLTVSVC